LTTEQNSDALDIGTSELDAFGLANASLSEDWDFEAPSDEAAAALELDWETADNGEATSLEASDLSWSPQGSLEEPLLAAQASADEWEDLNALLGPEVEETGIKDDFSSLAAQEEDQELAHDFDDLEALLAEDTSVAESELDGFDSDREVLALSSQMSEFEDLEALLADEAVAPAAELTDLNALDDLDALLLEQTPTAHRQSSQRVNRSSLNTDVLEDEFGDLEKLLEQADTMGGPPIANTNQPQARPSIRQRPNIREQTMRVPIKHLDSLSNLVGELVVNRNSLEQDQERLRQFLDNLSHQVLALSDVGSRMQDLYERTLLESSLLASRQNSRSAFNSERSSYSSHTSDVEYDPLEMDRFTGFHLLPKR
jgi:chemosensory pili system protein ChpA (sensor histidine kinase/response regulator)